MTKRAFFSLLKPGFNYDLVESDPVEPRSIPTPDNLILLINEPLNSTKKSLIKRGYPVKKGEKLCLYEDSTEYAVSPVTGSISSMDIYLDDLGNTSTYLVIQKNQDETTDPIAYDLKDNIESADNYLRTLPGGPPFKILADSSNNINTVIITCIDVDLMATTNQYVASRFSKEIKEGAEILKKLTGVPKLFIAVPEESDFKEQFDTMQTIETSIRYPSNFPALILHDHLDINLPAGKSPEEMGACFISAEAVVSLGKAYKTKTAGFEKHLTIIGKEGKRHRITATVGTSLGRIFKALDIHISSEDRVVIGCPMKGTATYTLNHPVQPDMDTVLIQDSSSIPQLSDNACINCGKCVQICPAGIPVNILVRYLATDKYEEAADKYDLESCIECGLCAYVCIAQIPLFQFIKLGKHELSAQRESSIEMETADE